MFRALRESGKKALWSFKVKLFLKWIYTTVHTLCRPGLIFWGACLCIQSMCIQNSPREQYMVPVGQISSWLTALTQGKTGCLDSKTICQLCCDIWVKAGPDNTYCNMFQAQLVTCGPQLVHTALTILDHLMLSRPHIIFSAVISTKSIPD